MKLYSSTKNFSPGKSLWVLQGCAVDNFCKGEYLWGQTSGHNVILSSSLLSQKVLLTCVLHLLIAINCLIAQKFFFFSSICMQNFKVTWFHHQTHWGALRGVTHISAELIHHLYSAADGCFSLKCVLRATISQKASEETYS